MRTLIIYYSKTGNTEKYANEIGSPINATVIPFKKFKKKMIKDFDTIVFGGRVIGNRIQKLDEFLRFYDDMEGKNIILFSVGMSMVTKDTRLSMISSNLLDMYHVRYYQLRGSFDFQKLGPVEKLLFNHSINVMAKDPAVAGQTAMLEQIKETPIEFYDHEGIAKIVTVLNKLSAIPEA